MKHKLQKLLKHNWRTLLLLLTLITTSQGIWGGNEDIYIFFKDVNSWESVYCYLYQSSYWDNTNGSGSNNIYWCSNDNPMKFIKKDTDGKNIYGIRITGKDPSQVNYISFTKDAQCGYGNFYNTKAVYRNDTGSSFNHKMYTPPTTKNDTKNGTDYFSNGSWSAWCDELSAPANVVSGTDIMLYAYQHYDSPSTQVGITKNTSACIGTATEITSGDKKHSVIQVASSEFSTPFKIYVSNNCGNWGGESCDDWDNQSASDAQGSYYKHESSGGKSKVAATTATVSLSSSSITEGTESIDITIVGSSANSSYDKMLYAIIYVDGSKDACKALATSPGSSYTLNTSSLSVGEHTIKIILADGTIYYIGDTKTLTVRPACTGPSIETDDTPVSVTDAGATLKGTVTTTTGDCEVKDAGIAYGTSTNPTTPASYGEPTSGEAYSVTLSNLSPATRYYYRAYVTAGGVTTYGDEYSFYTNPSELYIKGPLVYDSKWDPYTQDNVGYSHTAGTNTFVFSFNARTGGGGHDDYREYCVSTSTADGGKIHSSMDGTTSGWSFESSSGSNFVASSTIVSEDETPIEITITYNNNTGLYHMVLTGACSGAPTIDSDLSSSTTWSKCGNADGRQLSITASGGSGTLTYQWFRNTTNTLTDGVADLTGATAVTDMVEGGNTYSPSASDYGKFYYCCVVRSGGACSANKATSVYTGEIEIKQTPTVKPSTITVKQYEPVRLQATNSSVNWSITTHPGGAAADEYYLYDETKNSAMFKGKTGSYTVTATSTGSDCTSTSAITVENDPDTCN